MGKLRAFVIFSLLFFCVAATIQRERSHKQPLAFAQSATLCAVLPRVHARRRHSSRQRRRPPKPSSAFALKLHCQQRQKPCYCWPSLSLAMNLLRSNHVYLTVLTHHCSAYSSAAICLCLCDSIYPHVFVHWQVQTQQDRQCDVIARR